LRIDWALLARYVEVNEGLATIVGAGIDAFAVPALPCPLSVPALIRVVGLPDDQQHPISVRLLGPDLNEVGPALDATFGVTRNPAHPSGWEAAALVPIVLQFEASAVGTHSIEIRVDSASRTLPFRVILPAPPPA